VVGAVVAVGFERYTLALILACAALAVVLIEILRNGKAE
jgi:hypothetical protein